MRSVLLILLAIVALGCGSEIGDECVIDTDCDPNGQRRCIDPNSNGGYCTIQGCDYSTCPDEAVCVRFFTGAFDKACTMQSECSFDELCSLAGRCVARNSEIRYCMRRCGSDSDCRDGYECRDLAKMQAHGGEPLLAPGLVIDETSPKFCAVSPR